MVPFPSNFATDIAEIGGSDCSYGHHRQPPYRHRHRTRLNVPHPHLESHHDTNVPERMSNSSTAKPPSRLPADGNGPRDVSVSALAVPSGPPTVGRHRIAPEFASSLNTAKAEPVDVWTRPATMMFPSSGSWIIARASSLPATAPRMVVRHTSCPRGPIRRQL